jgi:hypothetical protein|tara:strand:+ start:53 stop:1306 length:1254 start_codon:yes stop_codon:yes gene_type:complete
MANKEALKFQEALANKIKTWEQTEDFAAGSSNRQKLNRSLNLLLGSDPEIVIDMLGGDFVPDDPREAMNLIRGLDLKTLKSMEILDLKGLGNKLVGHHGIAASTLQALRNMPPAERLKVYKGLADMGQRFGMDPKQIFLIADKIHKSIAHEGDFSGVKTKVTLPYIVGETGDEFLKRFEAPMKRQLAALENAVAAGETQDYYKAINVLEDNLQFPRGTLADPNTPIAVKDAATKLFKNVSPQIRDVVTGGGDIKKGTQEILKQTKFKEKPLNKLFEAAQTSGIIKSIPKFGVVGGAVTLASLGLDAKAASETFKEGETPMETTANMFGGISGALGLAASRPSPFQPALGVASGVFGVVSGAVRWRVNKDAKRQADIKQMDPATRTNLAAGVEATLQDTNQLKRERSSNMSMLSGSFK